MLTLKQIAHSLNGVAHGITEHAVSRVSSLSRATGQEIAYFSNPLLKPALQATQAGIVLLKEDHVPWCPTNALVVNDPLEAIKKVAALLMQPAEQNRQGTVDVTAKIHPSVQLGRDVVIGPYAIISEQVIIADGVTIGAHSFVGCQSTIGSNTHIENQVVIQENTHIAEQVYIDSGCIIGASPFNYLKEHGIWQQGVALGGVVIENNVRIGANTVIDKGSVGDTYLASGVCIDNLVHVAHDVYIGANTAIAGCVALGAHVIIGADCIIGGASCIAAFVRLADDVVISGMSTVSKTLSKAGIYSSGTLIHEHQRWRKNAARFRRLDDYVMKLRAMERKINEEQ